jgi:FtsP/CotA-like multicopper oxidase with cupredoxin domain
MNISRRQLLWNGATLAAFGALGALTGCGSDPATTATANLPIVPPLGPGQLPVFPQPPAQRSVKGLLDTALRVAFGDFDLNGQRLKLRCYNNALVGPTLRVRPGDVLRINLLNDLPPNGDQDAVITDMNLPHHVNSTNLHTHGLHVSPLENSDNIFVVVDPNSSFQYEYRIPADHPSGTFWYHPHKHGSSAVAAFSGMAGALIVEGGVDTVPEVAVARDLVYIVAELNIDPTTGQVSNFAIGPGGGQFLANRSKLIVNGTVAPTLHAFSGEVVRLRLLNASPRRAIPYKIDSHNLEVLALDGITLPSVRSVDNFYLAPANRADVLVRAGAPGKYAIRKLADPSQPVADPEEILGYLEVHAEIPAMGLPTTLPVPASLPDILSSEVTNTRTLRFNTTTGGPGNGPRFSIDGQLFDPNRIDHTIPLGAVEEWELINESGQLHPFHIHVNPFQVISINGVPLPRPEWRDTIDLPKATNNGQNPGRVVIRHRFEDFKGLFVLHCHILVHEDLGMMQTVNVI